MIVIQARLLADAEAQVQIAHDALVCAMRAVKAAESLGPLPTPLEDDYLDLCGSAGPLDRMLKQGNLTRHSTKGVRQ